MHSPQPDAPTEQAIAAIADLFERYGHLHLGERCSQLEHARQCAALAEAQQSPRSLVCAAFLHDIGHLQALHQRLPGTDSHGHKQHDRIGARLLEQLGFAQAVYGPMAGHVQAKQFLLASEPAYGNNLSAASRESLKKQGGPLRPDEQLSFLKLPYAREAIQLRRWDEAGKQEHLVIPELDYWLALCRQEHRVRPIASPQHVSNTQTV